MDIKNLALKIAWKMWGQPYIWGGDDPIKGFDCSGMCIEILKSVGVLPRKGDWTANGLGELFKRKKVFTNYPGCLVFWGDPRRTHVEFIVEEGFSIGASGGGRRTTSSERASSHNAYVKIRPLIGRNLPSVILDPFLKEGDEQWDFMKKIRAS